MTAFAVLILFIFMARSHQRPDFWIWTGKGAQFIALLFGLETLPPPDNLWLVPAFVFLFAPAPFFKAIVVPLGMPRFAYWATRCCGPVELMKDAGAGAALYGALALARRGASPKTLDWLAQRAKRARSVKGAGVATGGLLAALRGEHERARALFLLADTLPAKLISGSVRVVARDWLVADAAQYGNWREVVRLGRRGQQGFRWSNAVAQMGRRLLGDPDSPHDWLLWLCWLVAPRRRATWPLLRRALAVKPRRLPVAPEPAVTQELPEALAAFAQGLAGRFAQDSGSLVRAVGAVEGALARPSTRALIERRLPALGARGDADAIIDGFRRRVIDLVDPLIEEQPQLAGDDDRGSLLDEAVGRIRSRLFREIGAQCKDCNERQQQQISLEALTEWEIWAAMRDAADRLLALSPGSEHALFHTMYVPMCNYAVFQHNICKRIALAHDIFAWLRRHSESDVSACELLSKNMKAGQG